MRSKYKTTEPIGFDDLFKHLNVDFNRTFNPDSKYPPYNVVKIGERDYLVEIAAAGFSRNDLSITLDGRELVVEGSKSDVTEPTDYIHQGISNRSFSKSFTLNTGVEVSRTDFVDGMLTIWLTEQEGASVKRIEIGQSNRSKVNK